MATILIVDDRPANRELLVTLLGYAGHRLLEAIDGEQGLALARSEHPDLIITDIVMPKMDGYEFARQVRVDASIGKTRIIFYTSSYIVEETRSLADACGVSTVIGKPIEPEIFLETVRKALENEEAPPTRSVPDEFHHEHMRLLTDTLVKKVEELEAEIVERKQAEMELAEAHAFLEEIITSSPIGILTYKFTGECLSANEYAAHILGASVEQLQAQNFRELDSWKDSGLYELAEQTIATRQQQKTDIHALSTFGKTLWLTAQFVVFKSGAEDCLLLTISDITERKLAEKIISRLAAIVESSDEAIIGLTLDGEVDTWNLAAQHLYGYSAAEIVGRPFSVCLPPSQADEVAGILEKLKSGEHIGHMETLRVQKDGESIYVSAAMSAIKNIAGQVVGISSMERDIRQQKRAEEMLLRLSPVEETAENKRQALILRELAATLSFSLLVFLLAYYFKWFETIVNVLGNYQDTLLDEFLIASSFAALGLAIFSYRRWLEIRSESTRRQQTEQALRSLHTELEMRVQERTADLAHINEALKIEISQRKQAEAEIRQRLSELEVLYQSGLTLSQIMNPKAIAKQMVNKKKKKMNWHHTAIRLYDPQDKTLELLTFNTSRLKNSEERDNLENRFNAIHKPDQGLSGWVIQHGEVVRSGALKDDPRYFETFPGLQSGLYVPIKIGERMIGVISIESERANAFSESDEHLVMTLATQAAIAIDNALLLGDLQYSNTELSMAYDATIAGWSGALDLRDKETEGHSQRVTEMTLKLARIFGLSSEELVQVRRGALLHDIGKMGVPDHILLKPGALTDEEWTIMRKHPENAYKLLSPIAYLKPALDIPYCHHEKWDGTGYPRGLKGEEIPLAARLFAIVDVWDALRSDRPYRAAWTEEKTREHVKSLSGTHFDPRVVKVFLESDIAESHKNK